MRSLVIVFAALLLIIVLPFVFQGIDGAITQSTSQAISGVTTGAGIYSANITLGRGIYNNDTTSITGIASDVTADVATTSAWNSVSKVLEVSGLDESQTRILTIDFMIDSSTLPDGAALILSTLTRWLFIFAIPGALIGAIYAFFQS